MSQRFLRYRCALVVAWCVPASVCLAGGEEQDRPVAPHAGEMRCEVVPLEHVDCEEAAKHIRCLFAAPSDGSKKATWFTPAHAVLLRGTATEVDQMKYLLGLIDTLVSKDAATSPSDDQDPPSADPELRVVTLRE